MVTPNAARTGTAATEAIAYPAAVYGKRASTRDRPQEYGLLGRSDDFSPAAVEALAALGRAFRWPGGKATHAPAFVLWPIPGERGVLAARLLDVGRDDQGRPHLLRIEAIQLASTSLGGLELAASGAASPANLARLAGMLSPDAWPNELVRDGAAIRLTSTIGAPHLAQTLAESWHGGSLLVVHEAPLAPGNFDLVVDPQGRRLANPPTKSEPIVRASRGSLGGAALPDAATKPEHPWLAGAEETVDETSSFPAGRSTNSIGATTMARSRRYGGATFLAAIVAGAALAGFAAGWFGRDWAGRSDATHRRELGERDEAIQSLEAEREQVGADVEWMRQQILRQQKTVAEQQSLLDVMLRRLNRLSTSPPSTAPPTTPDAESIPPRRP